MTPAATLLDAVIPVVRARLPASVDADYLDAFLARHRPTLVSLIDRHLGPLLARAPAPPPSTDLPELWTPGQRTAANLAAMAVAARLQSERRLPTPDERRALAGYSGWGGLSIESAAPRFPAGFPVPEARGLIHEYYTPSRVASAVASAVAPLIPSLPAEEGVVHALEPSAGIGRFLRAFASTPGLVWHAVEWSELSSRMLAALFPGLDLFPGPFERWVRERGPSWSQRLGLLISNPPYGARGAALTEDTDRAYREKRAYAYFLRRGLDLLAPGGLGVFLIPSGFLTGRTPEMRGLREQVLKRHHLAAAFRLPSVQPGGGRRLLFPGAMLVTDLLFFRARGGELPEVDSGDQGVLEGRYFQDFPRHLLGRELGQDAGDDDQTKKPRYGYQVEGEFSGLPALVERPICADCTVIRFPSGPLRGPRVGVARQVQDATAGLPEELASAVSLGLRVDRYLAQLTAKDAEEPALLWPELNEALLAWRARHGNPHTSVALAKLVRAGNTGAERFVAAFERAGGLIPGLRAAPPRPEPRYTGKPDDVLAQAELLYRGQHRLDPDALLAFHRRVGGAFDAPELLRRALDGGWCLDGETFDQLVPAEDYLTGSLWPRYDRASALAKRGAAEPLAAQAEKQARRLLEAIAPAVYEDIEGVSPRQGWVPLDLVSDWLSEAHEKVGFGPITLTRDAGMVFPQGWSYEGLDKKKTGGELHPDILLVVGWMNHDKTLFSPPKERESETDQDIDKRRLAKAAEWEASFRAFVSTSPERRRKVEDAYNRQFRGYLAPSYSAESLPIARWKKDGPRLHPHQVAGARRVLANRGGLLAFDVGVGKTYTGLAVVARARQEGWCKRPVVLVPNSIVWKWYADFQRVLPDYRVAVIGSKQKTISRGERKGFVTSDTDTPAERAEKWTRFQAGEYDVVLLSYTALGRTRMNEGAIREYAKATEAIQREVTLRRRNAGKRKKLSERDEAILKEGVAAWVAQQMELPADWAYDPGVAWDDIGVDLLVVDEAQNFKNLYLPEDREGGIPRFMGNPGDGSRRAWQLDFRCASVRRRTGGTGVVLLSATPAKNSPLEFYNLLQYIDPRAWTRMGIRDPEQFIDRYLKIELRSVVTPQMKVEERGAVVGFQNLHELRDVIFRYGEFKTAEEVGLRLPEPRVEMVDVDMDAGQDAKYDRYVQEIEAALKSTDPGDKARILGLMARMALVAIHAELDEGYTWKTAGQVRDPSSPKFEALADRVLANRSCGHIVFVDNVSAHAWVRDVLIDRGIAPERIGILNAEVAEASADRQRIAREFNGDPEAGVEPRYDVVIANAIAYEGVDLQTRTCAIHHLDLPWEPATLQQRNGRGVRQGNTLSAIAIYYYFARKSQDGLRFNLIQGKRGWMTQLLKSQDRDTNNPGAQMDMGPEEILLLISRDPEQTRARLEAVKAQREAEAKAKIAVEASKLLRSIHARFRQAERVRDPANAARLRAEAEERLKALARTSPEAWPWLDRAHVVRERPVVVVEGGGPLYEGLRIGIPNAWDSTRLDHVELGRVTKEGAIGLRAAGQIGWSRVQGGDPRVLSLRPEQLDVPLPPDDEATTLRALKARLEGRTLEASEWTALGWELAPDAWTARIWAQGGEVVLRALGRVAAWRATPQKLPVLVGGELRVLTGPGVATTPGAEVLPPTDAGWRTFLEAAPASKLKFGELAEAAAWWWGRSVPRNLLSAGRGDEDAELEDAA